MKRMLVVLVVAVAIWSCAPGPMGAWNYSVTGTPQGDYKGVMTITKTDTGYAAKLSADGGEIPFEKFEYIKASKKTQGSFSFQGTPIDYAAILNKDELKGSLSAGGMDFPFNATRKK